MEFKLLTTQTGPDQAFANQAIIDFLHTHLEQFGDSKAAIAKCLDYVFDIHRGGFIVIGHEDGEILGVVVVNHTGMSGYIPENILVYIAIHNGQRGRGLGKKLMKEAIANAIGSIALHVEPENPAKYLYENLGFTNKYLEMRLEKGQ